MRIDEAAKASGLSADTIRYYERTGIVPPIPRDSSGHRRFGPGEIEWMTILYWLRQTGMSMKDMSRFAEMVHAGEHTRADRHALLSAHAALLAERRRELDACEAILKRKLAVYAPAVKGET